MTEPKTSTGDSPQMLLRGDFHAFGLNEAADGFAVTPARTRPHAEREIDESAGFIPVPERPPGHIDAHTLAALSQKAELPVVNDAGAVGRQVCQPAVFHQTDEERAQPILDGVRAKGDNDRAAV